MTLTDVQYQALIIVEVGDDAGSSLAFSVPLYWERHRGIADPELRYLDAKRDAIDLLLGPAKDQVDVTSDGDTAKLDQRWKHLLEMRNLVNDLILQASSQSDVGAAAGALTTTAPIMAPIGALDSNAAAYRGSPYVTRRRRHW